MSEQHEDTPETTPASTETDETPSAGVTTPEVPENGSQGDLNAGLVEARDRYRQERDTARDELSAATALIERMQRAEIERLASASLSHPADLFSLSGNGVADYLGDDGTVDADKVAADVTAILQERPGMKRLSLAVDHTQGHGNGRPGRPDPTWSALLTD